MQVRRSAVMLAFLAVLSGTVATEAQEDILRPYVLASRTATSFDVRIGDIRSVLTTSGFTVVGEYTPYDDAHILIITSDSMRQNASASEYGGYGAAVRVSVTRIGEEVQVSFTNPVYLAHLYRLEDDLSEIYTDLTAAIGFVQEFGSEKGFDEQKLRRYRYMPSMPQFDNHNRLARFDSHDEALAAVESGLAAGIEGTAQVYRIEIPGKDEVLFGVSLSEGKGADAIVMETCDTGELKHTAYLPWEILVSGSDAYAHHGRFRIAASFPDLTMGTFMKIVGAPPGIKRALKAAAEGSGG